MKKDEIIVGLIEARGKILDAAASLSPEEQDEVFLGVWSVKDLLAHLAGWDFANLEAAQAILAGRAPTFYAHYDRDWRTFNARLVAEYKRDDFAELVALVENSHRRLVDFLRAVPAEEFDRDHGVRFKGYEVTIARLLQVEMDDERKHHGQVEAFRDKKRAAGAGPARRRLRRHPLSGGVRMTWRDVLRGDPIPWLLEPENPSVRYWALVDLLGRPADDPDVLEARAAIAQQPLVQELYASQHPEGHWGDDETKPYTAEGTLGVLGVLHTLGVEPDERTAAGCDSFLRFCQHESGSFSMVKTRRSGVFPCTTGEHLPMLVYFGLGDDPRVRRAFTFVIEDMAADHALDCGRYQHRDCLWGAIAALNGLAVLPDDLRSPQSERTVKRLADALLDADYDFEGEHKRWLTFGVPRMWDLLSALRALAAHGYGRDPRFAPLLQIFLARQDEEGRWLCGSVSRTWPLEKRGQPSKWVTLDALRLLRVVEGETG